MTQKRLYETALGALTLQEIADLSARSRVTVHKMLRSMTPDAVLSSPPPIIGARPRGIEAYPGARTLPWSEDWQAQEIVEERGAMTLHEVAEIMGCTRERIRQIEEKAMRKLRRTLRNRGAAADLIEFLRERLCTDDDAGHA